ncbi:helix-hairpin-helix domain-containing protein [Halocatena halophila]|uniref:helix-hairpin-helix domain-containing protein n=1 Tax=Halocatena halophila TaxID=2814576 RepID=UPI002ED134F7
MPTLRWSGDTVFTDHNRNFRALPGTTHTVSEEQVAAYSEHRLFGDDWSIVETGNTTEDDTDEANNTEADFSELSGVGESTATALREAGFNTFEELADASPDDLTTIDGISNKLATGIIEQVEE